MGETRFYVGMNGSFYSGHFTINRVFKRTFAHLGNKKDGTPTFDNTHTQTIYFSLNISTILSYKSLCIFEKAIYMSAFVQ